MPFKYSNDIKDVYVNICDYNLNEKCKTWIEFDDSIGDTVSNKIT